jgi:hypothetical protein
VNFSFDLPTDGTTHIVTGTFAIALTGSACTVFGNAEAS